MFLDEILMVFDFHSMLLLKLLFIIDVYDDMY